MRGAGLMAGLAAAVLSGAALAADLEVRLTVAERAGVARTNEPVSNGVPFPKGALKEEDAQNLALFDAAGRPIPAQFQVTDRWWAHDRSVRWVLVSFVTDVAANGAAVYTLKTGAKAGAIADPIKVEVVKSDDPKAVDTFYNGHLRLPKGTPADRVTVDTGKVKFTVRRKRFNLFDEVWAGGKQVVASHDRGLVYFTNFKGDRENTYLSPSNFEEGSLEVLEQGPVRAVLKLAGRFAPKGAMPAGFAPLEYAVYIHAWRGSPIVKVTSVYRLRQGALDQPTTIDGMYIDLPLTLGEERSYALGTPTGRTAGALKDEAATLLADQSDHYVFGGAAKAAGEGKCKNAQPQPDGLGWVDLSDGEKGMTVGLRRMWQQWPKALEARPDGSVRAHLWANIDEAVHQVPANLDLTMEAHHSDVVEGRHNLFPGSGKTQELVFAFHGGDVKQEPAAAFRSVQTPAWAVCDKQWYCEKTLGFGPLASNDPALYAYNPAIADAVDSFDRKVKAAVDFIIGYRGKEYPSETTGKVYDMYGHAYFGNFVNYVVNRGKHLRIDIMWDNNYYDYSVVPFAQFARTGDLAMLEHAVECDTNTYDFCMMNWHPNKSVWGCGRAGPAQDQVRGGQAGPNRRIYAATAASWHKTNFYRWRLFGDYHAYEASYFAATYPGLNPQTLVRQSGHGGRAWGQAIRDASLGYLATGDERLLEGAKWLWAHQNWGTSGGRYMRGVGLEGAAWYWHASHDPSVYEVVKNHHPMVEGSTRGTAATFPMGTGLLYAFERDPRRLEQGLREFKNWKAKNMWGAVQMAGETLRNMMYFTLYLADPKLVDYWEGPGVKPAE